MTHSAKAMSAIHLAMRCALYFARYRIRGSRITMPKAYRLLSDSEEVGMPMML
ncbi:hypothetical protein D9M69_644570 [compost metagenome]